ncbi:MAG TPA: twin-arginine translocase TatA/TatE family subunit [Verrucomicrobiae bacterium]|nr:twin-arginine translocase TatA/TatE family subunit [Verrucomicrobiae bacterium]
MEIGWTQILLVLLIVLILFGAKRIPEVMKSMGQGVKEFKKAAKDITSDDETDASAKPTAAAPKDETKKSA